MELDKKQSVFIWRGNILGHLSAHIIYSKKQIVFRERSSRKTVGFEEQIMSKVKYSSIFLPQMEAIVYFPQHEQFSKLGNITQILLSFGVYLVLGYT